MSDQQPRSSIHAWTRVLKGLLVLILIVGLVRLAILRSELSELSEEYERLAKNYGALDVRDPSKFLITHVETGDPLHFLWRCYYPPGLSVEEKCGFGIPFRDGMTMFSNPGEYLLRQRFEFERGRLVAHTLERGGGGRESYADTDVTEFLKRHWNELEFDLLAKDGPQEIATSKTIRLLTIRVPENLLAELEQRAGVQAVDRLRSAPLYQATYGTPGAFQAESEKNSGGTP